MKEQRSKPEVPPSPMREFLQTSIKTTPIQSIRIGNSDIEVDLQKVPVDRVAEKFEERGLFSPLILAEYILRGVNVSEEAEKLGIVNKAVPADKLEEATNELASRIVNKSPLALRGVKRLINRGIDGALATGLEMEIQAINAHGPSEDAQEGIAAFIEKREPKFTGN